MWRFSTPPFMYIGGHTGVISARNLTIIHNCPYPRQGQGTGTPSHKINATLADKPEYSNRSSASFPLHHITHVRIALHCMTGPELSNFSTIRKRVPPDCRYSILARSCLFLSHISLEQFNQPVLLALHTQRRKRTLALSLMMRKAKKTLNRRGIWTFGLRQDSCLPRGR